MNSLQDFETATYKEWVELSGIDPDLYRLNVECVPDEVQSYGGDVSRPLHEALGWTTSRWSLKGKERNYGAIIRSHDGSVFQVKLKNPVIDKTKNKPRKYETPLGSNTKPFLATVTLKTWISLKTVSKDTVVTFLYKYINQKITTEKIDYRDLPPAQISEAFWQWVEETHQPVLWCEGAKKALCLLSHGYIAIALSGVSNGYRTPKDVLENKIGKSYLIPEVAKFIKGQEQNICFDSDTNPKTIKGVNANIKAFGGLINAKAKEVTKAKSDIDTVRVLSWDSKLGKGVDDLIVGNGIEKFAYVLRGSQSYTSWKIANEGKFSPVVNIALSQRYLGSLNIPKSVKLLLIKAAMGTGKTETIAELIKDRIGDPNQAVIVVSYRDNLVNELGNRFGLVTRKELNTSDEGSLFGYVLCADSLHSKARQNPFNIDSYKGKTITVVIDECESVAWHILSAMTAIKKNRPEVLENLSKLLAMALTNGQVILSDAQLSDRSYEFFKGLACQSKPELIELDPFVVVNSFKFTDKPWTVQPFSSKCPSGWYRGLTEHLATRPEAKLLIQVESQKVNSKWSTQSIEADLKAKYPDKKIVRVDSETCQDKTHPAYGATKNFTNFCQNWDIVICSNVIESGISIDLYGYFDSVWACIWGVSSPKQANQMLARLRDSVPRYAWIAKRAMNRIGNGSDKAYALMNSTSNHTKATIQALQQNGLGDLETDDGCLNLALKTWASYGAEINHQGRNLPMYVLNAIARDGHIVNKICDESDKDTDIEMDLVRDSNYIAYTQSVEDQTLLDENQAKELEKATKGLTIEQQKALRKYRLEKTYGESSADTVTKDDKNWFTQLTLHYYLTVGKQFLMEKDTAKVQELAPNGKAYAVDVLKATKWRKVKLLEAVNILNLLPQNGEVVELWNGCDRLTPIVDAIKHWRYEIKNVFGITLNPEWFGDKINTKELVNEKSDFEHENSQGSDISASDPLSIKIIKPLLKLLGAKLLPIGKRGKRGSQERAYRVVRDCHYEKESKTYIGIVEWGGDNRYQVFDTWLNRDTEKQNVSTSDTVSTFLYKDNKQKVDTEIQQKQRPISVFDIGKVVRDLKTGVEGILERIQKQGDLTIAILSGQIVDPQYLRISN